MKFIEYKLEVYVHIMHINFPLRQLTLLTVDGDQDPTVNLVLDLE